MDLAPDKNVTATVAAAGTRNAAALRNAFVGYAQAVRRPLGVELHEPDE